MEQTISEFIKSNIFNLKILQNYWNHFKFEYSSRFRACSLKAEVLIGLNIADDNIYI